MLAQNLRSGWLSGLMGFWRTACWLAQPLWTLARAPGGDAGGRDQPAAQRLGGGHGLPPSAPGSLRGDRKEGARQRQMLAAAALNGAAGRDVPALPAGSLILTLDCRKT